MAYPANAITLSEDNMEDTVPGEMNNKPLSGIAIGLGCSEQIVGHKNLSPLYPAYRVTTYFDMKEQRWDEGYRVEIEPRRLPITCPLQ